MHGLAVYVKEGLPFARDLLISKKHCKLTGFISPNVLLSFPLSVTFFLFMHMCLSLETLMSIIRTGLPILVKLIDLVNSVIIFLSQITLLRWLTFLLGSQTVILTVLLFWIYFFFLMLVFVLQWLSLH